MAKIPVFAKLPAGRMGLTVAAFTGGLGYGLWSNNLIEKRGLGPA